MREFSKNGTFSGYSDRKELFQCRKHSKLSGKIPIRKILKDTRESLFSFPVAPSSQPFTFIKTNMKAEFWGKKYWSSPSCTWPGARVSPGKRPNSFAFLN